MEWSLQVQGAVHCFWLFPTCCINCTRQIMSVLCCHCQLIKRSGWSDFSFGDKCATIHRQLPNYFEFWIRSATMGLYEWDVLPRIGKWRPCLRTLCSFRSNWWMRPGSFVFLYSPSIKIRFQLGLKPWPRAWILICKMHLIHLTSSLSVLYFSALECSNDCLSIAQT